MSYKNSGPQRGFSNRNRSYGSNSGRSRRSFGGARKSFGKSIPKERYISKTVETFTESSPKYIGIKFSELNLNSSLYKNVTEKGYLESTEIQAKSIPAILEGKDLVGISSTGSGKTAAFLIPMVNMILQNPENHLLVVAPTRELAEQIKKEALTLIKSTFIRVELVVGGENMFRQIQSLRKDPSIIVGTPGRLLDHIKRGTLKPSVFNKVVIDEVDRMLDMGFIKDIREIYSKLSSQKQTLFFSATLNPEVKRIISGMSANYITVEISQNKPAASVYQDIIEFEDKTHKIELLHKLLLQPEVKKSIVFIETKRYVDFVEAELEKRGVRVGSIHGDKTQGRRKSIIQRYRSNEIKVLIATNVAARGLDISDISHVINYDEPQTFDEYIHRIGRTGRNGNTGFAFTFVPKSSGYHLH